MQVWLIYVLFFLVLLVLLYLLWRLNRLEGLLRRYKCKNQEGVGALSRTRNQFFLLLALIQLLYTMLDWQQNGLQTADIYRALLLIGLPMYLYFSQDRED
ncbi:Ca2+/Na+ antiporter [Streptococcus rupicaprae]|uniref:Ca2+/Na+ antiporter n=1 Tax=Streptococcus rupicaprae TaxID=759619 RepID=A0ABV2FJ46_9STRE